jgi:hypothetical protein
MKPWLYVGAKVVCVDAGDTRGHTWKADKPIEGAVYTIAAVFPSGSVRGDGPTVLLEEIRNTKQTGGVYGADRFRPVSTIDTKHTVNAMRNLMLDATVRGKVSA